MKAATKVVVAVAAALLLGGLAITWPPGDTAAEDKVAQATPRANPTGDRPPTAEAGAIGRQRSNESAGLPAAQLGAAEGRAVQPDDDSQRAGPAVPRRLALD